MFEHFARLRTGYCFQPKEMAMHLINVRRNACVITTMKLYRESIVAILSLQRVTKCRVYRSSWWTLLTITNTKASLGPNAWQWSEELHFIMAILKSCFFQVYYETTGYTPPYSSGSCLWWSWSGATRSVSSLCTQFACSGRINLWPLLHNEVPLNPR